MTEVKSVMKKNHFGVLTSFTGSVEKQSRAAPQEGKKLKKKIEGKKRRIWGFGRIWTKFPNCPGPRETQGWEGVTSTGN